MEVYKANKDGVIFKKSKDPNNKSGEEADRLIKKGELIFVKNIESITDEKLSLPFKKYNLINQKYALTLENDDEENYIKASFADVPEHLFIQIQKPRVYITLGVVLIGLAVWSIINERKNV